MSPKSWCKYVEAFSKKIEAVSGTLTNTASALERLKTRREELIVASGTETDISAIDREIIAAQRYFDVRTWDLEDLRALFSEVTAEFNNQDQRKIGRVEWVPPLIRSAEPDGFTQDVCVIKLDRARFEENFRGNLIDLGPDISAYKLTEMMNPPRDQPPVFAYPEGRLLPLTDILPSTSFGPADPVESGAPSKNCEQVIKHGRSTNTTIGRANGIMTFTRNYELSTLPSEQVSIDWAILPYDSQHSPFAKEGDSGSVVVTGSGQLAGLLVGGSGSPTRILADIAYATPMYHLCPLIQARFPGAMLHPDVQTI